MPTTVPQRRRDRPQSAELSLDEVRRRIASHQESKNLDAACEEAIDLARKLEFAEQHVKKLSSIHTALRQKLEAMMAPAHFTVTITAFLGGTPATVEVIGLGNSRVQVSVHPDVDPQHLVTGATAIVSQDQNCLLKVISPSGRWQETGSFERFIDSENRILVNRNGSQIALDVANQLRGTRLRKGDQIGFDGDSSGIAYERLADPDADDLFDENVSDDFAMLGGLDSAIERLKQKIGFNILNPSIADKYALESKCGILLEGAPGNGKTHLARASAAYVRELVPTKRCRFMHVSGSSDYSKWLGESERNIEARFQAIRKAAEDGLVVVFWDEIDALARARNSDPVNSAPGRILNVLLTQLDGVIPLANVVFLFATNRADTLDPAFIRAGRTDEVIKVPRPNRRATSAILHRYLDRGLPIATSQNTTDLVSPILSRLFAPNGDFAEVAQVKLSDGRQIPVAGRQLINGAMLKNIVKVASQKAAIREAETGQEGLMEQDLASALESEMSAAVSVLAPSNVKNYVPEVPQEAQPIAVNSILTVAATERA